MCICSHASSRAIPEILQKITVFDLKTTVLVNNWQITLPFSLYLFFLLPPFSFKEIFEDQ